MKVLILTPIQIEHEAVLAHLSDHQEEIVEGSRFVLGTFSGKSHQFEVVTQVTGSGNSTIALATERAVKRFRPIMVLLVGVAGGVKDVGIGDIVVGTRYYDYECAHESNEGTKARPRSGHYSKPLKALAESVNANKGWWNRLQGDLIPNVVFGTIASGSKIMAGTESQLFRFLKNSYNDTTAIEMEAAGFGEAMRDYPHIYALNIRGISDLLDGKQQADRAGSQELASANVAAFVFEMIHQFSSANFWTPEVEIKDRFHDFINILKKAQNPALPKDKKEDYAPPPNRAPHELEHLKPLSIEDRSYILDALEKMGDDQKAIQLKSKLDSLFDFQQLGLTALGQPAIQRYKRLEQAKADKMQVILQDYRSNSNVVRDRKVEPFKIDADRDTLQAFDIDIEDNRHFRLSRIRRVLSTGNPWEFENKHVRKETDDFRIADNDMVNVQLRLDVLAYNLLTEAYPNTKRNLQEGADQGTWFYDGDVNHNFYGLINFIMGNADHVEVLGPESLKQRMQRAAEKVLKRLGQ